jgi:hypothetical protein
MNSAQSKKIILFPLFIFIISLSLQLVIILKPFAGNFYWATLSSTFFTQPAELLQKIGSPLYSSKNKNGELPVGWDGQFYYLVSNNLFLAEGYGLGQDAPAYRYQRVGLPLIGRIASALFGYEYTTPFLYWASNQLIFLIGLIVFSYLLHKQSLSPFWLLAWAGSVGTQSVLLHGLGDAAADSFFLIFIFLNLRGRIKESLVFITLAILCREIYLLICPMLILCWLRMKWTCNQGYFDHFLPNDHKKELARSLQEKGYLFAIPIFIYVSWYFYIFQRTGVAPSAAGPPHILGFPFKTALDKFVFSLSPPHFDHLFASFIFSFLALALFWVSLRNQGKSLVYFLALPVIFVVSCLGTSAFDLYRDYLKGLMPLLVLAPFFIRTFRRPKVFAFILAASILIQPLLFFNTTAELISTLSDLN